VATAYYAGLRNSEPRFLTWDEIDFDRSLITIRNKPGLTLKNCGFRSVPLNKERREILLPPRKEKGRCFTDPKGRQLESASKLYHEFDRLIVRPSRRQVLL